MFSCWRQASAVLLGVGISFPAGGCEEMEAPQDTMGCLVVELNALHGELRAALQVVSRQEREIAAVRAVLKEQASQIAVGEREDAELRRRLAGQDRQLAEVESRTTSSETDVHYLQVELTGLESDLGNIGGAVQGALADVVALQQDVATTPKVSEHSMEGPVSARVPTELLWAASVGD